MATAECTHLSVERVRGLLSYDPETGLFRWKVRTSNRIKVGDIAGRYLARRHFVISLCGAKVYAHILAWFHVHGIWPDREVDHKDGNPTNNRISNLRLATHAQNIRNAKRPSHNTSGFKGVSRYKKTDRWRSRIKTGGRNIMIGVYQTPEEAARSYDRMAIELFGDFARLNFPEEVAS